MSVMSWLMWFVVGAVTGWLANMILGTKIQHHSMLDILAGIVGGMIAGGLFEQLSPAYLTGFNIWSLFAAFVGAVILLGLLRVYIQIMQIQPVNTKG